LPLEPKAPLLSAGVSPSAVSEAPALSAHWSLRSKLALSESARFPARGLLSVAWVLLELISLETLLARAPVAASARAKSRWTRIRIRTSCRVF